MLRDEVYLRPVRTSQYASSSHYLILLERALLIFDSLEGGLSVVYQRDGDFQRLKKLTCFH